MRKLNETPKTSVTQTAQFCPKSEQVPSGTCDIILTVANFGYIDLLLNFCVSLRDINPDAIDNLLVLTFDPKLVTSLKERGFDWINVKYVEFLHDDGHVMSEAVKFKTSCWNRITRFKLLAIWLCLQSGKRNVFYYDPDIVFVKNPLSTEALAPFKSDPEARVWIQRGRPYCNGVIFASSERTAQSHVDLFDPKSWEKSRLNDEEYLTMESNARGVEFGVLDFTLYPNGLVWYPDVKTGITKARKMISNDECILMHFNFISTPELKLKRMKELGVCYV